MNPSLPDWIPLGTVGRAHGIKGAVFAVLSNPAGDALRPGVWVVLGKKEFEVEGFTYDGRLFLRGISTRTEAEKLTGSQIWIRRQDLAEPKADEIYLIDLMGYEAVDLDGRSLGKVTGFADNRAQHLVELEGGRLIPFVKPILVKIDELNKQIILDYHDES